MKFGRRNVWNTERAAFESARSCAVHAMFAALLAVAAIRLVLWLSLLAFPLPRTLMTDFSRSYYYADRTPAWFALNASKQFRVFCPLDEMSVYGKKGIVEYEDKFFFFHPGCNPVSIVRAFIDNMTARRTVSGGSTITMQLVRLSEPRDRTLVNKIVEVFRAIQFEAVLGKERILELYLNTIPMGGNIQGIEAASYFYFGKTAKEITFGESALLIGIANSPSANRPDRHPEKAADVRKKVAQRIAGSFRIDAGELRTMLDHPVVASSHSFDADIIPLIERFGSVPEAGRRVLTIDRRLQKTCLSIIRERMSLADSCNGALILVENRTRTVISYIGSPFYSLGAHSVRYNAAHVRRSPGSTLKPFIYARALEEGLITPGMKLLDVPYDKSGYAPKNYSNTYLGIVPADEALFRSLNIPAIVLEEKLGAYGITSVLRKCGLVTVTDGVDCGDLSIVLGSHPLTLEDMTALYCSLANGGIFAPLLYFEGEAHYGVSRTSSASRDHDGAGKRLLSDEACYIVHEMLSGGLRPDLHSSWEFTKDLPKIAFKTGTGYGFVDAWTIAYTPRYTIGVWTGKLDNRYSARFTGSESTAPVAFRILDELHRVTDDWFARPARVRTRKICAVSGMLPGPYCRGLTEELAIDGVSPCISCAVHRRIVVEKSTGKAVSPAAISETGEYEEKIIEVWPEEIERFIRQYGKLTDTKPGYEYADARAPGRIIISSPAGGAVHVVNLDKNPESRRIACAAYQYPDSGRFYWYANGRFIGSADPDERLFYEPEEKKEEVTVVDEKGRTGSVTITVSFQRSVAARNTGSHTDEHDD